MESLSNDLMLVLFFSPILLYGLSVAALKAFGALTFNRNFAALAFSAVLNLALLLIVGLPADLGWVGFAQMAVMVIFFFLVIFFLGGKVGPETIFAFCALIGLPPLMQGWAIPGLVAGLVVFCGMVVYHMHLARDSIKNLISSEVVNAAGNIMTLNVNAYENIPDKKDVAEEQADQRKFSMLPTVLAVGVVGLLWRLLMGS